MSAIKIYPDTWAALNIERAGQKFRPGNGTEGECFTSSWCGTCARDHGMLKGLPLEECDDNQICEIVGRTYMFSVDAPEYPSEWKYGKDGQPCCTAYVPEGKPIPPERDTTTTDMFGGEVQP